MKTIFFKDFMSHQHMPSFFKGVNIFQTLYRNVFSLLVCVGGPSNCRPIYICVLQCSAWNELSRYDIVALDVAPSPMIDVPTRTPDIRMAYL